MKIMRNSLPKWQEIMIKLVTMLRPASLHGAVEVLAFYAILATFCQFGDFGNSLAIFLLI